MDVDDAKIREEAKAILKEIMDPSPDPKKEQIEIWEAWFDRMADGGQPRRSLARSTPPIPFPSTSLRLKRYPGDTPMPKTVLIPLHITALSVLFCWRSQRYSKLQPTE